MLVATVNVLLHAAATMITMIAAVLLHHPVAGARAAIVSAPLDAALLWMTTTAAKPMGDVALREATMDPHRGATTNLTASVHLHPQAAATRTPTLGTETRMLDLAAHRVAMATEVATAATKIGATEGLLPTSSLATPASMRCRT